MFCREQRTAYCRKTGSQSIEFQSTNNPDWQIIFFYVPTTSIRLSLAKISELLKCRATIYGCEELFSSFPAGREQCFCYGFPQSFHRKNNDPNNNPKDSQQKSQPL